MSRTQQPRSRIINFRLTEREYSDLISACASRGERCLSEFARSAVLDRTQAGLDQRLLSLDEKLATLHDRLQAVLDRLP